MFKSLVGIDTAGGGYGHIVLRPGPPSAGSNPDHAPIHWVKAEYDSIRGKIAVDWKQNSRSFEYKVTIPANTTAMLYLPTSSADKVTESGNSLKEANGVNLRGMEGARVKLALDSGTYHFIAGN
jgi:alpha-L-rhamnosidase